MAQDSSEELTPATGEELVHGLAFAMRYQGRKRVHDAEADSFMARVAAERLTDYLHLSGFVVMKKPPTPAHSGDCRLQPCLTIAR